MKFKRIISVCFVLLFNMAISENNGVYASLTATKTPIPDTEKAGSKPKALVNPNDTIPLVCCGGNVFTPNGDGVNDVFRLPKKPFEVMNILMFDRWGNKVYEANNVVSNDIWDGKDIKGKDCKVGTYFYLIKAKELDDTIAEVKGTISLFR